jgi:hypothetical protein
MTNLTGPQATGEKERIDPPATPSTEGSPESLDKVRDILFGGQMRMVETRLQSLESRFQDEIELLRADFLRRLTDLDGGVRKELAALSDWLAAEAGKRAEDLRSLGAEFRDSLKALERRHARVEEATSLADAELRDQILTQRATLSAELSRLGDTISSELERRANHLASTKLDTSSLVAVLNELALRLDGNGRTGGKAGDRS